MRTILLVGLLVAVGLAGCADEGVPAEETPAAASILRDAPTAAYIDLDNTTLSSEQLLALANATGTYYSIGSSTFEPTIGVTSSGALFMSEFRGTGSGTHIRRSQDQGLTWDDATPLIAGAIKMVPNSNDPFIYVDPFTDRVYDFDMCVTLSAFCVAYSDDDGETWTPYSIATGEGPALDHQSLAATPPVLSTIPTTTYDSVLAFCVNRGSGLLGSWCSSSFDGGLAWTPLVPGFPVTSTQCSGLSAHLVGSPDGRFYRGNPSCDGPAVYMSEDGGLTWSESTITTETGVMGHEVATATDDAGNVYAFWIGSDGLPYLAASADHTATWTDPIMVAPEGVTAAGFPTNAGGAEGRVAFAYIGSDAADGYSGTPADMNWTGYLGFTLDAFGDATVATVPVNTPEDPLDGGRDCGRIRCGGFGDFIDMVIDAEGRPWVAFAHNGHEEAGIVGTLASGPSLRLDGDLAALPVAGAEQW